METHLQELRFAKERQWAVAIATITFIAGAFHMAHTLNKKLPLRRWEQGREFDRKVSCASVSTTRPSRRFDVGRH